MVKVKDGGVVASMLDSTFLTFTTFVFNGILLFCSKPIVLISRIATPASVHNNNSSASCATFFLECLYRFEQSAN